MYIFAHYAGIIYHKFCFRARGGVRRHLCPAPGITFPEGGGGMGWAKKLAAAGVLLVGAKLALAGGALEALAGMPDGLCEHRP